MVRGIYAGFGAHDVLTGVDLAVPAGEVHGLVGRNGAGKTTLLATIAGFVEARAGTIAVHGREAQLRDLAYLPVDEYFYGHITGREYLGIFREPTQASRDESRWDAWAEKWATAFELPLDQLIDGYSTGMRRKLAIVGALRLQRSVLLLDEPANGLDLEANQLLILVLRELAAQGAAILVTSHVLEALEAACDRIHLLDGGRIAGSYTLAELPALRTILLGDAGRRLAEVRPLLQRAARA